MLFGAALFGVLTMLVELVCLWILLKRRAPEPTSFPSFSILKPLCGLDDELLENLKSHLQLDYPGEYEVLLGVRSESDLAYPIARDFATAHSGNVRLVMQQGEPGRNPKVNQLITLTRAARHQHIAITDSNVRVQKNYLREIAALLENPKIGLTSNLFVGVGEQKLGAILDNLIIASFCAPSLAGGQVLLGLDEVVGKSLALRREVLDQIGGWHEVVNVLAEDQRLGMALRKRGFKTALCRTPVENVQRTQGVGQFWARHTRWAMLRFRVILPGVLLEPVLNPFVLALLGAAFAYRSYLAWAFVAAVALFEAAFTQVCAVLGRGYPFRWRHLLWTPVRDILFFGAWLRGATMRWVTWRGNRLHVLAGSRLAEPDALARVRKMQRGRL